MNGLYAPLFPKVVIRVTRRWPQTIGGFDRLIVATQDELIRFAFYRLGNRDDAEDVVQDVYVEIYAPIANHTKQVRSNPRNVSPFSSVTVGLLLRARSRQTGDPVGEESASVGDDAFSSVAAREEAKALSTALQSIPPKEAEVIRLRAFSDLSFAEIADAVGSPVPTVKSRFRYGLDKLRRLLVSEEVRNELPRRYRTND